jgi:hypothetical protein
MPYSQRLHHNELRQFNQPLTLPTHCSDAALPPSDPDNSALRCTVPVLMMVGTVFGRHIVDRLKSRLTQRYGDDLEDVATNVRYNNYSLPRRRGLRHDQTHP